MASKKIELPDPVSVDLGGLVDTVKNGVKTSEFWLTVLFNAAAFAGQYQGALPEPWGIVAATTLTAVYTIVRAVLKWKTAQAQSQAGNF